MKDGQKFGWTPGPGGKNAIFTLRGISQKGITVTTDTAPEMGEIFIPIS